MKRGLAPTLFFTTLASCAPTHVVIRVPVMLPEPPARLSECPEGVTSPPPPRAPRTIEQVAVWAAQTEIAREKTAGALAECARRLDRLNQWIDDHRIRP